MANAKRDENRVPTLIGVSSADGVTPTLAYVDPVTHRLLVDSIGVSIGDTITGGTAGSILFINPTATLAQDNSNLFWDDTNNFLGVGTNSPSAVLHVANAGAPSSASILQKLDYGASVNRKMLFGVTTGATLYVQGSQSADETQYRDIAINPSGGNVSIGTATANKLLTISGTGTPGANVIVTDNTTGSFSSIRTEADSSFLTIVSHASARVVVRAGLTLGGWTELLAQSNTGTNNGMLIDTLQDKPIVFGNNSVERMRINAGGNIGIGETGPATALAVKGAIHAYPSGVTPDNNYNGSIRITQAAASGQYINILRAANIAWSIGTVYNSNTFAIAQGQGTDSNFTSPFFAIDSSGNVGIGATAPAAMLEVNGTTGVKITQPTASNYPNLIFQGPDTFRAGHLRMQTSSAANGFEIYSNTTETTFESSGTLAINSASLQSVGILVASPLAKLHVQGTTYGFLWGYGSNEDVYVRPGKSTGTVYFDVGDAYFGSAQQILLKNGGGMVKIGGTAVRATTEGTNHLDIFNGTAPVGTLSNGASLYCESGEMKVMDAGGNATQISPHDTDGNWIYNSKNTVTGRVLKIDMEKMMKFFNKKFGTDFIKEFYE